MGMVSWRNWGCSFRPILKGNGVRYGSESDDVFPILLHVVFHPIIHVSIGRSDRRALLPNALLLSNDSVSCTSISCYLITMSSLGTSFKYFLQNMDEFTIYDREHSCSDLLG